MKNVKITGLSINEKFGNLKATNLIFNNDLNLTMVKGEVGAGKTTLNKAIRLTTQGSEVLQDKTLYGDNVNLEMQLTDGDHKIFIGCKSDPEGKLVYVLYEVDENGKKVNNPVIDGVKATPAAYMKNLQTALTWRMNELTTENPTQQRNLLLELYSQELQEKGVIFDKKHPNYVGSIIDKIEKAKDFRSLCDMKRKEVGGIAEDLNAKGIDLEAKRTIIDAKSIEQKIITLKAEIALGKTNIQSTRDQQLTTLKLEGSDVAGKLKVLNQVTIDSNNKATYDYETKCREIKLATIKFNGIIDSLKELIGDHVSLRGIEDEFNLRYAGIKEIKLEKTLSINENGAITSKPNEWEHNQEIMQLLEQYISIGIKYKTLLNTPLEDTTEHDKEKEQQGSVLEKELKIAIDENKITTAIERLNEYLESDKAVRELNRDYFNKLTEIDTGVEGLKIAPEYILKDGQKIAKGNDIFLMYDGSYDTDYFHNPNKELRKLAAYSDTQKPMICLLIQNYLLGKKNKCLPYLWIDQVPIDKKTKALLDKMSQEMGLHLFVNWTGDFDYSELKDGEILIENGELILPSNEHK